MTIKELKEIALHAVKGTVPACYANQGAFKIITATPKKLDVFEVMEVVEYNYSKLQ